MRLCDHIFSCAHTHTCTYSHIHIYTYTYTHMHIHTHIHTYIHTYIHKYTHMHTYHIVMLYKGQESSPHCGRQTKQTHLRHCRRQMLRTTISTHTSAHNTHTYTHTSCLQGHSDTLSLLFSLSAQGQTATRCILWRLLKMRCVKWNGLW